MIYAISIQIVDILNQVSETRGPPAVFLWPTFIFSLQWPFSHFEFETPAFDKMSKQSNLLFSQQKTIRKLTFVFLLPEKTICFYDVIHLECIGKRKS